MFAVPDRGKLTGVPADEESLKVLSDRIAELTEGTPEREALLARLAEQIRNGTYQVDADALASVLAENLLSEETDPQK